VSRRRSELLNLTRFCKILFGATYAGLKKILTKTDANELNYSKREGNVKRKRKVRSKPEVSDLHF